MYHVIGPIRTRTLRVLWMLEELAQPYEHVAAAPHADAVVEFNPAGKVPVLVIGGVPVTDSIAILTYLADKHQALTFPPGTLQRARQDSLTQFINDEFDQILWTAARHSFILPENRRVPEVKDSLKWEFARSQARMVTRMSEDGPFVMGDTMTIPDILLTHCLGWAVSARFPVVEDRLRDFAAAMRARPAYIRALGE
jgi:glutathione S-transferase